MIQHIDATGLAPAAPFTQLWAWVTSLWQRVEPIDVVDQRFNFLPHCFRWRGDVRRVRAIERVWEQPARGVRSARRYFEVVCGPEQRFVLFQDVHVGTWHVSV